MRVPAQPSSSMLRLSTRRHQTFKPHVSAACPPPSIASPCLTGSAAARMFTIGSSSSNAPTRNQVFDPVRNEHSLQTYLSLSTGSNTPLLTLWTASWCPSCRSIAPLLRSLIAEDRVAEDLGGVNYVPVEFDAPDAQPLATTYMITAIPTLLAFDPRRGEPAARIADARKLADRNFLVDWIREQAKREGGGGGGAGGGSAFGGLFGR